ncbi:hypothetical protein [Fodinicurvata sp. EGI_FJ10296]|uniref:hypothetical protein n=1 Tax=Fodinicurvata sp. EGI_FJ10296 TaxID=3231908 RepID=UPI003453113E
MTDGIPLESLLDGFRDRYRTLTVAPEPLDLTDCYWSAEAGRHVAPRSYGPLPESRVLGYLAFGGAFVRKFAKDADGRVLRRDGLPVIGGFSLEQRVMACLCLYDIRNTSLYEISDAMDGTHRVQGYRRWHLRRLIDGIRAVHPDFSPDGDSCFLFAGPRAEAEPRIALNALWLRAIIRDGRDCLKAMSGDEADLMAAVFPGSVLAGDTDEIRRRSYMWGREIWQPQSADFLARKIATWRDFTGLSRSGWAAVSARS